MPRAPSSWRILSDATGEIGIGIPIGVMTLIDVGLAVERCFMKSWSMSAASYGAAGHLKKGPRIEMTTSPPSKDGSISPTRSAPATE